MKVTRILGALLLLAIVTVPAAAQPTFHLGWDLCQPGAAINKDFAGPAGVYKLVVSGTGFAGGTYLGHEVVIALGSPGGLADAWRFDNGPPAGCQTGQLNNTSVSTAGVSKACPALENPAQPLLLFQFTYDDATKKANLRLSDTYTPSSPVASSVTLFAVTFNHAFSVTGPADPAVACGNAERPVCIHTTVANYLDANNIQHSGALGQEYVTWQDAQNTSGCPGATPTRSTTWGSIKNQYQR